MGVLLFSGYFGFAQTATLRIMLNSTIPYSDIECYGLQYKKASEGDTAWVRIEVTPQDNVVNDKYHTFYTLTNLECGTEYDVWVHVCMCDGSAGVWTKIKFTTPPPYDDAPYRWEIGPFDILCRQVGVEPTAFSVLDPNVEEIWASEERDTAKEAIKEE